MPESYEPRLTVETLWRTASTQCEFTFSGLIGWRLRLWIDGALRVNEEVFNFADGIRRAAELKLEHERPRPLRGVRASSPT